MLIKTTHNFCMFAVMLALAVLAQSAEPQKPVNKARPYNVVVYGGTSAGVIAAVQAARMERKVVLIDPGRHLGGVTSGGLGATDFGRKETIGGLAREFYRRIKRYYDEPAAWKYERREDYRSKGNDLATEDAMWHFEPHVAEKAYNDMVREAKVEVVLGERLDLQHGVEKHGARIASITMESGRKFAGRMFIDATYEGDLMARAGVSYCVGREANSVYGETVNGVRPTSHPPRPADLFRPVDPYIIPGNPASGLLHGITPGKLPPTGSGDKGVQAYNYRLCLTNVPENRVPFPKPADYDPAKYELMLRHLQAEGTEKVFPYYPNPLPIEHPGLGKDPFLVIMPNHKTDMNTKGAVSSDYVGMNWDYPDGDYAMRERIIREHMSYQQGMMWFLQHDPRVPARYREPMQAWGLAKDEFTDTGHWPFQLYVREARRMIGGYVMIEQDCRGLRRAEDSVGIGSYGMDSHFIRRYVDEDGWVQNEGNMLGGNVKPYPIAYRSIIPRPAECENLLVPVCISASHVAYGSIRMEPVFMILGQSAGTAAALASDQNVAVQALNYATLRVRLLADGQILDADTSAITKKSPVKTIRSRK